MSTIRNHRLEANFLLTIDLEPDEPTLDGHQLPKLIDLYLKDCELYTKPVTVTGYRTKLRWFLRWWDQHGAEFDSLVTRRSLAKFKRWLQKQDSARGEPLSYHSRNDVLRRLRQLFIWAHQRNYIPEDLSPLVPSEPGGSPPLKEPAELSSLKKLIEACRGVNAVRNRAAIALMAGTGMRLGEVAALKVCDIRVNADLSGRVFVRKAKMDQSRLAVFDPKVGKYVVAWLDLSDRRGDDRFIGVGRQSIYRAVSTTAEAASVDDLSCPHDLRHLYITHWNRQRRGEAHGQLLMMQVGHRSWGTTLRYSHQRIDELEEAFVSPLP